MIDFLQKLGAFLVAIGVLVVFHELGHYVVARLCGVKVLRFSVGFGRVLWSRRAGADRTEWAISAIPLGGYLRMADEREAPVDPSDRARAFNRQSVGRRIAIVAAGPIANLLLAVLLYAGSFVAGIPGQLPLLADPPAGTAAHDAGFRAGDEVRAVAGERVSSVQELRWRLLQASGAERVAVEVEPRAAYGRATRELRIGALDAAAWEGDFMSALGLRVLFGPPQVVSAVPGKPAARAGIQAGDRIVAIDGIPVGSPAEVAARTNASAGSTLRFAILRDGQTREIALSPEAVVEGGKTLGIAGLRLAVDPDAVRRLAVTVRYGVVDALAQGVKKTADLTGFTLRMLGRLAIGEASLSNISGPITMADFAGQSAQAGLLAFVGYLALISVSLGVLNLLPIPLLDGGHLLYYFAEIIRGSPVSDRAFEVGQRVGIAALATLMALAVFNDLSRLF